MIEVRYAGVVVGRSAVIRELDTQGLFLGMTEPMPVGTPVLLRIGDRTAAEDVAGKVEVVSESQELAHAGMRVRFADPRSAVLFGTPSEAAPAPPEPKPVAVAQPAPSPVAVASPPSSVVALGSPIEVGTPHHVASAAPIAHRRIVIDASTDKAREPAAPEPHAESHPGDGADVSGAVGGDTGRIAAPDPSAFGSTGGGGKRGRRKTRR